MNELMNVFELCLFSKFVEGNEPGVHGGVTPRGSSVGGVLLEVYCHVMGGPGRNHHETMERLRRIFSVWKWRRLIKDGASFIGGRHMSQDTNWRLLANMVRH